MNLQSIRCHQAGYHVKQSHELLGRFLSFKERTSTTEQRRQRAGSRTRMRLSSEVALEYN
jgi:hypothetical protein